MEEVAKELDVKKEDVVLALDSIQDPISLFEPVFNDDGDPIYVMDQIRDVKNTDVKWIENLSLSEAMKKLSPREQDVYNRKVRDSTVSLRLKSICLRS